MQSLRRLPLLILAIFVLQIRSSPIQLFTNRDSTPSVTSLGLSKRSSFGSENATFVAGFVPGPHDRGTLTIVFSCTITLFLCIWTAIHINIDPDPKADQNKFKRSIKRALLKALWSLITLLFPEATLALAVYELKSAVLLRAAINETKGPGYWDLERAFYAVMGGFSVKDEQGNYRSLSSLGVLKLVQKQMLEISSDEVQDKSNASAITKLIVLSQALWMIIQVIGRAPFHLPVTLLELHTCLHTLCALVTYALWWHKPLDIGFPTLLEPGVYDTLKAETPSTNPTDPLKNHWPFIRNLCKPTADSTSIQVTDISRVYLTRRYNPWSIIGRITARARKARGSKRTSGAPGEQTEGQELREKGETVAAEEQREPEQQEIEKTWSKIWKVFKEYFTRFSRGYRNIGNSRKYTWMEGLLVGIIGLIYGGVHLVAWKSHFPTQVEKILWQSAATTISVTWFAYMTLSWASAFHFTKHNTPDGKVGPKEIMFGVITGLALIPTVLARLFILAETFVCLRLVDERVYKIPLWSNLWPHAQ